MSPLARRFMLSRLHSRLICTPHASPGGEQEPRGGGPGGVEEEGEEEQMEKGARGDGKERFLQKLSALNCATLAGSGRGWCGWPLCWA